MATRQALRRLAFPFLPLCRLQRHTEQNEEFMECGCHRPRQLLAKGFQAYCCKCPSDCPEHIEDLGQIPCPKGKKKHPSGALHRHSASPQQHPRTTALCSLSCNSCFSSWTPNINIEPWVLKFKIECPKSIQLKTYINVQWEQKY